MCGRTGDIALSVGSSIISDTYLQIKENMEGTDQSGTPTDSEAEFFPWGSARPRKPSAHATQWGLAHWQQLSEVIGCSSITARTKKKREKPGSSHDICNQAGVSALHLKLIQRANRYIIKALKPEPR